MAEFLGLSNKRDSLVLEMGRSAGRKQIGYAIRDRAVDYCDNRIIFLTF